MEERKRNRGKEKAERQLYSGNGGKNLRGEIKGGCMQYTAKSQTMTVSFKR